MNLKYLIAYIGIIIVIPSLSRGQSAIPQFEFQELSYGVYGAKTVEKELMEDSPSGTHSVIKDLSLIEKTEKVPAKLGTRFGVEYSLNSNESEAFLIEIEWIFPKKMIDNQGNVFESIKYPLELPANFVNNSLYNLEEDYEIVKGTWQLNILYVGKTVYSRTFKLK